MTGKAQSASYLACSSVADQKKCSSQEMVRVHTSVLPIPENSSTGDKGTQVLQRCPAERHGDLLKKFCLVYLADYK